MLCYPSIRTPFTQIPRCQHPSSPTQHMRPHPSQAARSLSAPSASGGTSTPSLSSSAQPNAHGTTNSTPSSNASTRHYASRSRAPFYATCGNETTDVVKNTISCTHARDVELSRMEPAHALELRKLQPRMPYRADAWEIALRQTGLFDRFPSIPSGLCKGFIVGYPMPSRVQTPPNSTFLATYEAEFGEIMNKELSKG